jgi:hypothetical protein
MDHETAEEIKRHFDVVAESLRSEVRTVAEGFVATDARLDRMQSRMSEEFNETRAMIRLSRGLPLVVGSDVSVYGSVASHRARFVT